MSSARHRLSILQGRSDYFVRAQNFWIRQLSRMSRKTFNDFFAIVRGISLPPSLPKRENPKLGTLSYVDRETQTDVRLDSPQDEVAEAVKIPDRIYQLEEWVPPFAESKLPCEEPWWADAGLPPSKYAFVEHFYSYNMAGVLVPLPETFPGEGRVTILLSQEEMRQIVDMYQQGNNLYSETITALQVLWLEDPRTKDLFTPARPHICSHPHPGCSRASTLQGFILSNPWPVPEWKANIEETIRNMNVSEALLSDPAYSAFDDGTLFGPQSVPSDDGEIPPPLPPRR